MEVDIIPQVQHTFESKRDYLFKNFGMQMNLVHGNSIRNVTRRH